jgi:hypothetical protein
MTALFALALLAADPAEIPKHLAETVYEGDLAEAKRTYDLAVAEATDRCKAALERASKSATMNGDLDKAVAYRDRAKALAVPEMKPPLVGKYEFRWSNGTSFERVFDAHGNIVIQEKDRGQMMFWSQQGGEWHGLLHLDGAIDAIRVSGAKVSLLHFPKLSAISGVGEKVK